MYKEEIITVWKLITSVRTAKEDVMCKSKCRCFMMKHQVTVSRNIHMSIVVFVSMLTLAPGKPDSPGRPGSPFAPLGPLAPEDPRSPGAP